MNVTGSLQPWLPQGQANPVDNLLVPAISLALCEPFRVGDKITIKDQTGTVEDITLRHTVIRTWENKRVIVPNAVVSNEAIVNYSIGDPKIQKSIDISIS